MAIKRVLLPLADAGKIESVVESAFLVARLHQAQLRGLLVSRGELNFPFQGEYVDPDAMRRIVDNARKMREEERQRARRLFQEMAGRNRAVEAEFSAEEGEVAETVAHAARLADISVLSGDPHFAEGDWDRLREAVLFRSGRPALIVPRGGVRQEHFERIVIAWKDSVEAARAVAAAQPFLTQAKQVHLVTVGEDREAIASLRDVEEYLQLHYAEVRSETLARRAGKDVGDILQHKAEVLGGAVLVMGAYSHWRWREQVFGGVTETVLGQARVPVIMAR